MEPDQQVGQWDAALTRHVMDLLRPVVKIYHRSEVRGLDRIPAGRCLLVCNHSGGFTPDFAVFAVDFYQYFGYDDRSTCWRTIRSSTVRRSASSLTSVSWPPTP